MKNNLLILLLTLVLFFPVSVFAETIVLKSGKTVEGKLIEKTDKYIKIDFQGVPLTYYLDEVESVDEVKQDFPLKEGKKLPQENNLSSIVTNEAKVYFQRGIVDFQQGNMSQAVSSFNKAIEISPNYANAYYNRGVAYFKSNKFDEAISDYDKSVSLNINPEKAKFLDSAIEPLRYKEIDFQYSSLVDKNARNIVLKIKAPIIFIAASKDFFKETLNLIENFADILNKGMFKSVEVKLLSLDEPTVESLWFLRWDNNSQKIFPVKYSKGSVYSKAFPSGTAIEVSKEIENVDGAEQKASGRDG